MPLDLNQGVASTGVATQSALYTPYKRDAFRVIQDEGSLVKLANVRAPLDRPTTVKITNTRIANVYTTLAKGAIPLGNQSPNVSGQTLFVEVAATASKVSGTQTILTPLLARIELRLPNDGDLVNNDVRALIELALGALVDGAGDPNMTGMMRGVLYPE